MHFLSLLPALTPPPFSAILSTEHNPILVTLPHTPLGQASARLHLIYFVLLIQGQCSRSQGTATEAEYRRGRKVLQHHGANQSTPGHPWGWNSSLRAVHTRRRPQLKMRVSWAQAQHGQGSAHTDPVVLTQLQRDGAYTATADLLWRVNPGTQSSSYPYGKLRSWEFVYPPLTLKCLPS